ncbi:MAG TPA: ATP-binding cassette domain-containing protein, partial [Bauldia sp.]|nr:ATP-binding cassette domain-containing protein [Bauldia sp.]
PPSAGRMRFDGAPLAPTVRRRANGLRRAIPYVFQNPDASLNPRMTVGGILARPLQVFFGLDAAATEKRIVQALEDVRLDRSYVARYPDQLSGGERQRVAIARAIVAEPTLLLCDEVLSALDVSVQANVIALLERLRSEHRLSMLFISHDLAVVRSLADRVAVLFRGVVVELGSVDDVFAPPFHPYTHALLRAVPGAAPGAALPPARPAGEARPPSRGCVFAGRCPWQPGALCERDAPPVRMTDRGLAVRCHLPLDELTRLAAWPDPAGATGAEAGSLKVNGVVRRQ